MTSLQAEKYCDKENTEALKTCHFLELEPIEVENFFLDRCDDYVVRVVGSKPRDPSSNLVFVSYYDRFIYH